MIFSIGDHIEQILQGTKTQTRRTSPCADRYEVGKSYAIQPGRTKPGIKEGRILITNKRIELRQDKISVVDASFEGCYSQDEFEKLYEQKHPNWRTRFAYTFRFVPTPNQVSLQKKDNEGT